MADEILPEDTQQDLAGRDLFIIIDGHALLYRAFHAFPELSTATGEQVNAVFGFTRVLLSVIRDFEPTYIAVASDSKGPSFRREKYEEYKAHREEMPESLQHQIERVNEVIAALNIPQFQKSGFEADDLIGTLVTQSEAHREDVENLVVTGDKDLLQLVTDETHVFIPQRGRYGRDIEYNSETVLERLGVSPARVIELKALMGDSSDNIPGVYGVGEKTALKLLDVFASVEEIYAAIDWMDGERDILPDDITPESVRKTLKGALLRRLKEHREAALLSKELVTIRRDAPIELALEDCRVEGYERAEAEELFDILEFSSLKEMLPADRFQRGVADALF